jgi:hypothetical protein
MKKFEEKPHFLWYFSKRIEVKPVLFGKDTLSNKEQRQKVKMATKCEQIMQNMIQETINHLHANEALKISTTEAFALFEMAAPKKVSKGTHKVVEKQEEMDEEEAALKMLAEAEEAVAKAEKETADAIAAFKKRPKGRPPKGKIWDSEKGEWIPDKSVAEKVEDEVGQSTQHYRRAKVNGVKRHCPHPGCNFSTCYSKNNLRAHILAKHTPENERPFQCEKCGKGFAQKAGLIKHRCL